MTQLKPEPTVDDPAVPVSIALRARRALGTPKRPDAVVVEQVVAEPDLAEHVTAQPAIDQQVMDQQVVAEPIADDTAVAEPAHDVAAPPTPVDVQWAANPKRRRGVTALCGALVAGAAVFAVVSGVSWWHATHPATSTEASARDQVAIAARTEIATLNTLDYRDVKGGLARWMSATTGPMHTAIAQATTSETSVIGKAKTVTKAVVIDVAVITLDTHKGTATAIASVQVTRTPAGGKSVVVANRVSASFTRVHNAWLLADLSPVQVQLS